MDIRTPTANSPAPSPPTQDTPSSKSTRMHKAASRTLLAAVFCTAFFAQQASAVSRNIMITGYWPPTNEMLRPWSRNITQNPGGWQGGNWENRGYDIHSYFPEFPGGTGTNPRGTGDFQVDYQAASNDFWRVVEELRPVAIITFSRGGFGSNWEIESRHRKLPLNQWGGDYLAPFQPTPELPIANEPDFQIRTSSLPMTNIRNAVNASGVGIPAFIDTSNDYGGTFVSEFTGYHSAWYAQLHSNPADPFWCIAGGHVHVGINTPTAAAGLATQVTLRELITHVDSIIPSPSAACILCGGLVFSARRRRPII